MACIALIMFLPLVGLMTQLIPGGESVGLLRHTNENLLHLWEFLLAGYLFETLELLMGVTLLVFIIGVGNAWLVVNYQFPGKKYLEFALITPLAIPAYVMAYLLVDIMQFSGSIQSNLRQILGMEILWFFPDPRSLIGAIWTFSFCLYPYVYLITRSQFAEHSACLKQASAVLGFGPIKTLWKVSLPLARPSILVGMALVWMEVLADYGAVSYFGLQTYSTGIFKAWLSYGDRVTAIQLALALFSIVILIFSIEQMSRSKIRVAHQSGSTHQVKKLRGIYAAMAIGLSGGTVLMGFILPISLLMLSVYQQGFSVDVNYFNWLRNSLILSTMTACITVALAISFAYLTRGKQHFIWLNRLIGFGYAIPGTVLAIGVLAFLETFQIAWIITSSIWILLYTNCVRFIASSINSIEAGLSRITISIDQSAAILGLTQFQILIKIHLPLLSRSIAAAGIFVFVDVMKELPATMLLRPLNFDTLAIKIYQLAADERLTELALPSLTLILIGLLPVLILANVMEKKS